MAKNKILSFFEKYLSFYLGKWFDIPLYIHWSLPLFIVAWSLLSLSKGISMALFTFFILVTAFTFVILHEFGHALMAKQFNRKTENITMFCIGGMARITHNDEKYSPREELYITLAGPAVNFAFMVLSIPFMYIFSFIPIENAIMIPSAIFFINSVLFIFNMIPVFPMDGGRVLRAILCMFLKDELRATGTSVLVSNFMTACMFIAGIFMGNLMLSVIAVIVYFLANGELEAVKFKQSKPSLAKLKELCFKYVRSDDISEEEIYEELDKIKNNDLKKSLTDTFKNLKELKASLN